MALVRWGFGDEDEREKEQQQLSAPRVIQSVQQGAWQPTQVSSDGTQEVQAQKPENYLMSEQKAQVDEGIRQRRAAEEQARAQAAAEAQARAQAAAQMQAQAQAQAQPQQVQKKKAHPGKDHNGWKKYYGEEFNKAQKGLGTGFQGFINRLIDGGQASKQAEIHARNRYNNELLAKAYDDNGNTLNQAAANKSREVAGYNMQRAMQSAQEVRARVNAMGANSKRLDQGFWNQMGRQVNAIKNMSLYDGAFGVNDTQKASLDDAGRFVGNLAQGVVTMPIIGAKEAAEAVRGRGTDAQTGFERELNGVERLGRGVSGALNITLPFMTGGGVKFMDDLFGVVAKGTATQAQKATLAQILKMSASGALTQGGLGAAQATGEWAGNGGSLLDEKGNLNEDKVKEFVEQVGTATAMSAAGGALFAGGGGALRNVRRGREPVPAPREPVSQPEVTPVRTDPVPVTAPVADGNVNFNFTPVRPNTPETPNLLVRPDEPTTAVTPADGVVQPANDVTPVADGTVAPREAELPEMRPVTPEQVAPEPAAPQVADGAIAPRPLPESDANMPVIRSDEVKQLQEARAGTTQAQEAEINQRLQQAESATPRVGKTPDDSINDKLFDDATASDNAKIKEFSRIRRSSGSDENLYDTLLNYEGDNPWLRSAAAYAGRLHEAEGVPLKDIFDDIAEPLPSVTETRATNQTNARAQLVKTIRDLEKSTGQTGLYKNVADAMRGMNEQQQVDFMTKAVTDMRERGVLAADFVNRRNNYTPASAKTPNTDTPQIEASKSESGVNKAGTLTNESEATLVSNDGWESYRDNTIRRYEARIKNFEILGRSKKHIEGLRQNLEAIKASKPNEVYRVNPATGKAEIHPASELLKSFSKAIGEDVPPIAIGNVAEQGSTSRLPANWAGADGTYVSHMSRLDYKKKNAVYHETMHHIDHFIRGYKGDNPKMQELRQLRDAITLEDMKKFKAEEWRADNKAEYVAHAMDSLLDGRIKAGQLGASVLKYIKSFFGSVKEALSSSHIAGRKHTAELAEYVKRLDAAVHNGKAPNQKPLSKGDLKPTTSNLPPAMQPKGAVTPAEPKPKKTTSDWAKRVYSQTDLHKDMKRRLATALGMKKDADSPLSEILAGSKVSAKDKAAITERYETLEKLSKEFNKLMQSNRKLFKADTPEAIRQGISQLDEVTSRKANKLIDAYGRAERDLNGYIRKVQGKQSLAHRGVNILQNVTGARNASLLSSVGGIERNLSQEFGANLLDAVMHPVKYVRGVPQLAPEVLRAYKRAFREYTVKPKTISEVLPYTIGNTYRVLMAPVTGQANYRKAVMRETLAESLLRAEGLNPTKAEIKKFAGSMGADSEVVANNLAGIMNGMTSHTQGKRVMESYQEFIHTGDANAKETFMKNAERSSNLAAKLSRIGAESDDPKTRAIASLINIVMPFTTTAINMAKTAGTYNFNPMARSIPDEVMKGIRSNPANALALLKANAVKGGVLASVYGLYESGIVQYNNGDEVDKPRGISIDLGNGDFFPVRGTPIEVPIAAVVAASEIAHDVADGKVREWQYYGGIIGGSLPYIDSTNNILAAGASGLNAAFSGNADQGTGDNGYAFKSYGVNMAKSFVPYSNNGIEAGINAWQGKSTDAKSYYDKDTGKWLGNSIRQAYDPAFRATLKDSRDAAGRLRTVDQQGGFRIRKGINDENTKTYNDTIDDLVNFGRDEGLGKGTQDMFNTYVGDKNHRFKGILNKVTFLDAPEVDGESKPDNATKLQKNEKLAEFNQQIYNGFFGDGADELLKLNGEELRSEVTMPNEKNPNKNSGKPISIGSIRNAIAQTDLPGDQWEKLNAISEDKSALATRAKAGEIAWSDYYAALPSYVEQENAILSNSKGAQKLGTLMNKLKDSGFFEEDGLGSTRAGQAYLWNSLNALLGEKGKTPAAEWKKDESGKGFTPWGRRGGRGGSGGSDFNAIYKPGEYGAEGLKWTPVKARQMANVARAKYTPVDIRVKLGNEVKRNKTQNYADRSF